MYEVISAHEAFSPATPPQLSRAGQTCSKIWIGDAVSSNHISSHVAASFA